MYSQASASKDTNLAHWVAQKDTEMDLVWKKYVWQCFWEQQL